MLGKITGRRTRAEVLSVSPIFADSARAWKTVQLSLTIVGKTVEHYCKLNDGKHLYRNKMDVLYYCQEMYPAPLREKGCATGKREIHVLNAYFVFVFCNVFVFTLNSPSK